MVAVVLMLWAELCGQEFQDPLIYVGGRCTIMKCPTPSISSDCDPGPQWSGTG
jgi:hypothetical protein